MKKITLSLCCIMSLCAVGLGEISGPVPPAPLSEDGKKAFPGYKPVGGIDFWNIDVMHQPEMPGKNIFPNPRFNQGLRYWGTMPYGPVIYNKSDLPRFDVADTDKGKAMVIRSDKQRHVRGLKSAPMALTPGKRYTFSFFAKSGRPQGGRLCVCPAADIGVFWSHPFGREMMYPVTNAWQRFEYTFTVDRMRPYCFYVNADPKHPCGDIYVTDLQLEEGDRATGFTPPEAEGLLTTSSPSNVIDADAAIDAKFQVFGRASGTLTLKLYDYWRKVIWEKNYSLPLAGALALPFDKLRPGTGSFCLQAKYDLKDQKTYYDYYRFTVLAALAPGAATEHFFCAQMYSQDAWMERDIKLLKRAGFGGTVKLMNRYAGRDYSDLCEVMAENNIVNHGNVMMDLRDTGNLTGEERLYLRDLFKHHKFTPDDEKKIEEIAFKLARDNPQIPRLSLANESELRGRSRALNEGRWDEWEKAVIAGWRGVKKARPDCGYFPDNGTSCYLPNRGYKETGEYLRMGKRNQIKWDFIAIHPYSVLDGSYAFNKQLYLDDSLAHLVQTMARYGYGRETPIYVMESFNLIPQYLPQWQCNRNGDIWPGMRSSYDFSREERNQAAWAARTFLIFLKYYPQLTMADIWGARFFNDVTGSMIALPSAVNTLRRLFPDPRFVCSFQPAESIFAFLYKGRDGATTAALWTSRELVEKQQLPGVKFSFKFDGSDLRLVDLMGNEHQIVRKDGVITLLVDSAPLFLSAGNGKALEHALRNSKSEVSARSLRIALTPARDGSLWAEFDNKGRLSCDVSAPGKKLTVPAFASRKVMVGGPGQNAPGVIYRNSREFSFLYPGLPKLKWATLMIHCYVPYTQGPPDWNKIPAFDLPHHLYGWKAAESDFSAKCQMAWNENDFFVRITARDSELYVKSPEDFKRKLASHSVWSIDGGLEFYINSSGHANNNYFVGMDNDDYRYDFSYRSADRASGKGVVYRRVEPEMQLMGATSAPSKAEAAKKVGCDFLRTAGGYIYTLTFPKDFIKPMALTNGSQVGISMSLIDIDRIPGKDKTGDKRLCLTGQGAPNNNPSVWAAVTLVK